MTTPPKPSGEGKAPGVTAAATTPHPTSIRDELRRISTLLAELGHSFERLSEAFPEGDSMPAISPSARDDAAGGDDEPESVDEPQDDDRDWDLITREALELLRNSPQIDWSAARLTAELHTMGVLTGSRRGVHWTLLRKLGDRVTSEGRAGAHLKLVAGARPAAPQQSVVSRGVRVPEPELAGTLGALEREIDERLPRIPSSGLDREARTAQLALWAGRARELRNQLRNDVVAQDRLSDVLHVVASAKKELGAHWIDALTREWEPPSWQTYCRFQEAIVRGDRLLLEPEEERDLWRGFVRALRFRPSPTGKGDWQVLLQAEQILGESDPEIVSVREHMTRRSDRAVVPRPVHESAPNDSTPAQPRSTPVRTAEAVDVLSLTRGRRALVISTEHEEPELRSTYQTAFKFSDFRWITANSSTAHHIDALIRALSPGRYHLAFFVGAMNEVAELALNACRDAGARIVTVPGVGIDLMTQALSEDEDA